MNISYKYIMLAAACLLTACQSNELSEDWTNGSQDANIVKVNATIAGLRTRTNAEGNGDEWTDGDKIRITNVSANAIAGKEKVTFIYDGNSKTFTQDGKDYAVWVDGENTFEAYYPSGGMAYYAKFVLGGDQDNLEGLRKNDWMTATATATKPGDNCVNLTFEHQLSKVTVKITKYNDQFDGQLPIIENPYFPNLSNDDNRISHPYVAGEYYKDDNYSVVKAYIVADAQKGKHSFTGILPPGKYQEGEAFMKFGLGSSKVSVPVNTFLTETGLEKGKAYTFNLTVGKNKASISSVEVNDWTKHDLPSAIVDETFAIDAANHTITLNKEGLLTEDMIKTALGNGHTLKVSGKISLADSYADNNTTYTDDLGTLRKYLQDYAKQNNTPINLDLSDAEITNLPDFTCDHSSGNSYVGEVKLPKTIEKIGKNCFSAQSVCKITNWDELTSLKEIGRNAFWSNINKGDITLPSTLTTLGESAFERNSELTGIVIPAGVTVFSSYTFRDCSALTNITYKGDMTGTINSLFDGTALVTIDLSACTSVPKWEPGTSYDLSGVTVYVKDADMKSAFEANKVWKTANAIKVKTE